MDATIAAEQISKRFGAREALRDVSFAAHAGERVAVLGPNGAGKTTLLSILAGVTAPFTGRVERSGGVGWVPQEPAVYAKLSVRENLELFARLERVSDVRAAVRRALEHTGLAERADDELGVLSGGNRQRVNLAVGLLADPAALLLDEPSAALDPAQRERLWVSLNAQAARGTTLVWTTHDVPEAARHADRVLVLAGGEIVRDGAPATPAELEDLLLHAATG